MYTDISDIQCLSGTENILKLYSFINKRAFGGSKPVPGRILFGALVLAQHIRSNGLPEEIPVLLTRIARTVRSGAEQLRTGSAFCGRVLGNLRYHVVPDTRRRFFVLMEMQFAGTQRCLFAAEPSEKPPVLDMTGLNVMSCCGRLTRVSCGIKMIWTASDVVLISRTKPFRVEGEDRTAMQVRVGRGEQIILNRENDRFILCVYD